MALHRKQRGVVDTSPQYVRIPTSGGRAVGYSLHEAHSSGQRVYSKRYMAAGDRSRKISSLQLRACFLLCVLLYFGAIYFADDIASIGRVVGSEQNSQNFFVHSLRPRGRNVRIGRAVDTKKAEVAAILEETATALNGQRLHVDQNNLLTEVPEAITQLPQVEVAKPEEAQLVEPVKQEERSVDLKHQDQQKELIDVPGYAVHPDDQAGGAPADQVNHAQPTEKVSIGQVTAITAKIEEPNGSQQSGQRQEQDKPNAAMKNHVVAVSEQPRPTAAVRHHEKEANVVAIPAASPSRVKEKHFIHENVDDKPKLPEQPKRNQDPVEVRPVVTQQQRHPAEVVIDGERVENDPVATPAQVKKGLTEHISDI
ncbi:hypothetical protein P3T76_005832 [Phytophthora citrophthora]|uniref:Transmembrane protein n=1 Tax=Phytophthora citrophthora TaxID=4793 RepID=A0AAD9GR57_9STRA|nr:hypothetical protein P3T76_005832 [Phytophthora citrophthora]